MAQTTSRRGDLETGFEPNSLNFNENLIFFVA